MSRIALLTMGLLVSGLLTLDAWGQNLLDKVEESVKQPLDRGGEARDGEPAPVADPPATADGLPPPAPGAEAPKSGYLGVVLDDSTGSLSVEDVAKNSPAAKAGLKPGDKVIAVNGSLVKDIEELGTLMEPVPAGGKLSLTVERDGKEMSIVATLGEPPPKPARKDPAELDLGSPLGPGAGDLPPPAAPPAEGTPRTGGAAGRASLGITVVTFNEETRRRSEVPVRSGAMITQIRAESPAARAGLPIGGVIVAYGGQRIDTADELVEAIAASRPGEEVELTYYQGNRLARKDVTLAAASDPNLLGPGYGGLLRDRPSLGRIERAIEGLRRPGAEGPGAAVPGAAPGGAPGDDPLGPAEAMSLREEIEALKAKVASLEEKVEALEAKLAPENPPADAGAAPVVEPPAGAVPVIPGENAAPGLKSLPPRPKTKAPAGAKIGDE